MPEQAPGTTGARGRLSRPAVVTVGRGTLIVIAVLTIAIPAVKAVGGLRHPVDHGTVYRPVADAYYEQFTCLEREVAAAVPRGAEVYVSPDLPWPADMWQQRLTEMTYPYADLVASPEEAEAVIGLESVPGQGCNGIRVTLRTVP